ncbi:MAG: metal-binding protein [Chloroflexi bacterium CFX6]|nr:metal-binding protein [Chloroflexi bacterium CFX6]
MIRHIDIEKPELIQRIKAGEITLGGNATDLIYGRLDCAQGKRLNRAGRVFFADEAEAIIAAGYRPCGSCMRAAYRAWKNAREQGGKPSASVERHRTGTE